MLWSYAVELLGTLAPVAAHFPLLAVAVVVALTFARASAQLPVLVPVAVAPTGHRHHYHRAAPYVRHKDLSHPGRPSPRAPDC